MNTTELVLIFIRALCCDDEAFFSDCDTVWQPYPATRVGVEEPITYTELVLLTLLLLLLILYQAWLTIPELEATADGLRARELRLQTLQQRFAACQGLARQGMPPPINEYILTFAFEAPTSPALAGQLAQVATARYQPLATDPLPRVEVGVRRRPRYKASCKLK